MIIHNPDITGSLSFPRADGTKVVMQISSNGVLETVEKDTNGDLTANKPASDFSGSFTGSFLGDGSLLTGVAASSLNIDLFTAGTISGNDQILFSDTDDSGNEKRATFQSGLNAVGVISQSAQIVSSLLNQDVDFGSGAITGSTFTGSFVGDGTNLSGVTSYTDSDNTAHLNSLGVISQSAQIDVTSTTNYGSINQYSDTKVLNYINDLSVISGSQSDVRTFLNVADGATNYADAQVKIKLNADDVVSGSASDVRSFLNVENGATNYGDTDVKTKLTAEDVVSGSLTTDRVSEGSNLYYTDARVKTKLTAEGVISGSDQIASIYIQTLLDDADAGAARTTLGVDASGTDNSTDVTFAGSYDYLTLSGQEITLGQVDASTDISNLTTANVSEDSNLYYTDARVKTKLTAEGVISGSSQVDLENVQGDTDDVSEGSTNLYFTNARATSALSSHTSATNNPHSVTKAQVGLGNVTNESKATMFTDPTFTGTVSGVSKAMVGLGNVDNTSDSNKPISTATQTALDGKLNINGDGVISGSDQVTITQSQVSDVTATAAELNLLDGVTGLVQADFTKLAAVDASAAELNLLDGVPSGLTTTEIGYLDGVTSNIQTQLNGKQASGDYVDLASDQTITGTKTFQDIAVNGTGSFAYIESVTGSAKIIGDAYIILNADSPAEQYSGIKVYDSGSGDTGSLEYDSANNHWFYESTTEGYASGLIAGPRDSRGAITFPSNNTILKGIGGNHIDDSNITDNGTTITLGSNTTISGGLTVTSITLDGTAISATAAEINKLDGATATTAELNYLDGVSSNIQTQLNAKLESFDITTQTDSKYLRSNANDTASGIITLSNSTASTSKTNGALVVTGGVGISGALNVGGDVVAYASSDERLKDNIELISNPIEKVQSLKGVTWNWNNNADELQQSLPNVGVIAQDVEKVLPQLVHDRDNGFKGVDYAKLTGLLIEAIKEQQKQIDELKSKLK